MRQVEISVLKFGIRQIQIFRSSFRFQIPVFALQAVSPPEGHPPPSWRRVSHRGGAADGKEFRSAVSSNSRKLAGGSLKSGLPNWKSRISSLPRDQFHRPRANRLRRSRPAAESLAIRGAYRPDASVSPNGSARRFACPIVTDKVCIHRAPVCPKPASVCASAVPMKVRWMRVREGKGRKTWKQAVFLAVGAGRGDFGMTLGAAASSPLPANPARSVLLEARELRVSPPFIQRQADANRRIPIHVVPAPQSGY